MKLEHTTIDKAAKSELGSLLRPREKTILPRKPRPSLIRALVLGRVTMATRTVAMTSDQPIAKAGGVHWQ